MCLCVMKLGRTCVGLCQQAVASDGHRSDPAGCVIALLWQGNGVGCHGNTGATAGAVPPSCPCVSEVRMQRVSEAESASDRCARRRRRKAGARSPLGRFVRTGQRPGGLTLLGSQRQMIGSRSVIRILRHGAAAGVGAFEGVRALQGAVPIEAARPLLQGNFLDLDAQLSVQTGVEPLARGRGGRLSRQGGRCGRIFSEFGVVLIEVRVLIRRQYVQNRFGVVSVVVLAHVCDRRERRGRGWGEDWRDGVRLWGLQNLFLHVTLNLITEMRENIDV